MLTTAFIATSIDGFIARKDGGIDWLPDGDGSEDYGYRAFMDSVDAIVMGRNTYEFVMSLGTWPYGDKPVVALSSRRVYIPESISPTVEWMAASPPEVVQRLGDRGFDHLYIDGGKTIQSFLWEGLLHRLIITQIPILLGTGIPLFGPLPHDVRLRHLNTQSFANGFAQSHYDILDNIST